MRKTQNKNEWRTRYRRASRCCFYVFARNRARLPTKFSDARSYQDAKFSLDVALTYRQDDVHHKMGDYTYRSSVHRNVAGHILRGPDMVDEQEAIIGRVFT